MEIARPIRLSWHLAPVWRLFSVLLSAFWFFLIGGKCQREVKPCGDPSFSWAVSHISAFGVLGLRQGYTTHILSYLALRTTATATATATTTTTTATTTTTNIGSGSDLRFKHFPQPQIYLYFEIGSCSVAQWVVVMCVRPSLSPLSSLCGPPLPPLGLHA